MRRLGEFDGSVGALRSPPIWLAQWFAAVSYSFGFFAVSTPSSVWD